MTGGPPAADRWFRSFPASRSAAGRLVCFPHAGGAATFFRPLSVLLGPAVAVVAVQYPGRQERRQEAPPADVGALADTVAELLSTLGDSPLAFLGHSMGAIVAFETALRLRDRDAGRAPAALFCSGRRAPATSRDECVHRLPDDALVDHVIALGGPAAEVLRDEEMRGLLLPTIRSDYRAIESYRGSPDARVDIPISVLVGDRDPLVTRAEADAWRLHTTKQADLRTFPGGHFYLSREFPAVAAYLRSRLSHLLAPSAPAGVPGAG